MIRKLCLYLALCTSVLSCSDPELDPNDELTSDLNVLLIVADDLGWMDLGCYGSAFYETPNLDRLASRATLFTDAYATCPVCSPTRASIMTGKYPTRLNITDWIPGRQNRSPQEPGNAKMSPQFDHQLALGETTIAEILKEKNYTTFFAGKWHLGQDSLYWPNNQGFEINKGGHSRGSPPGGFFSPYNNPRLEDGPEGEHLPARLAEETAKLIRASKDQRFFAYLSFYSVHTPLQGIDSLVTKYENKAKSLGLQDEDRFIRNAKWMEKAPERGRWLERIAQDHTTYAAMLESMDQAIGVVLDEIERQDLDEKTLIIFTSDNGGLSTSEGSPTSNLPLRGGKGWLYEGGIREPMIIRWPGVADRSQVSSFPSNSADILPTVVDILELNNSLPQGIDGISLAPALRNEKQDERALYWHYPHYANQGGKPGAVIRKGKDKLILRYEDQSVELYDLERDLGELNNLAGTHVEKAKSLERELRDWLKQSGANFMLDNPTFDPNYKRPVPEANTVP